METKLELVPSLFEQCMEVYETMADQATMQSPYPDTDEELLVYEGFLTRLIMHELHYSNPYYTKITQRLRAMDCIRQIKRGGSTTHSRWALLKIPTLSDFKSAGSAKPQTGSEALQQQIRALNERMNEAGI